MRRDIDFHAVILAAIAVAAAARGAATRQGRFHWGSTRGYPAGMPFMPTIQGSPLRCFDLTIQMEYRNQRQESGPGARRP